ncbi:MAG: T9SS C-terminal target domain-containing protein [Saprospirales bacterium]|nr:MAG: T9SS C-terminal target domain-containing protein [Saprospirales bacterium]
MGPDSQNEDVILAANLHSGPRKYASLVYVNSKGEEVWRDSYIEEDSYRGEGNARITTLLDGEHFMLSWVMDTLNTEVIDRDSPKFIKYNLSGDIVNSYKIPAPFLAPVDVFSITKAMNGDIIATGRARVSQSPGHGVIFRFSPDGELRWMKLYYDGGHGVHHDPTQFDLNMNFYDAVELPDGSILAGGRRVDTVGLGFANINAWLVRLDADGNCLDPDACGQLEVTEVVITSSSDPMVEVEQMSLFPNPTRDRVYIRQLPDEPGELWLFDSDGRLLKTRTEVRTEESFDLSEFPSGLYFVEYRSGDGRKIIQGKVLKGK